MENKRILIKLFFLVLLLIQMQLSFSLDCNRIDTLDLFESRLIESELDNGEVLARIVDTISSHSIYSDFAWRIEEFVDTTNQEIVVQLLLDQSYFCYDYCIKERNIYAITVTRYDSVFVEGIYTNNIDTLHESMTEFIANPKDKYDLPQKRFKYINYFDTVSVTRHGFFINASMIADSNGISSSWNKVNPIILKVLKSYLYLRNKLAMDRWDIPYCRLDFDKRCAVSDYYPLQIMIFPNWKRIMPPPPPPPYEHSEQFIIDSIGDLLFNEIIDNVQEE